MDEKYENLSANEQTNDSVSIINLIEIILEI